MSLNRIRVERVPAARSVSEEPRLLLLGLKGAVGQLAIAGWIEPQDRFADLSIHFQ